MIWMMILVKKGFISSNFHDHLFALPTFCGLFLIRKGAKGELSYKVKRKARKTYPVGKRPCLISILYFVQLYNNTRGLNCQYIFVIF